jgi:hypothetical protein
MSEELGFDSRQGGRDFSILHSVQTDPGALSRRVKRPGREAEHSPLSSVQVKNAWSYTFTRSIRLHGVVLN